MQELEDLYVVFKVGDPDKPLSSLLLLQVEIKYAYENFKLQQCQSPSWWCIKKTFMFRQFGFIFVVEKTEKFNKIKRDLILLG